MLANLLVRISFAFSSFSRLPSWPRRIWFQHPFPALKLFFAPARTCSSSTMSSSKWAESPTAYRYGDEDQLLFSVVILWFTPRRHLVLIVVQTVPGVLPAVVR